jgi:hypothetical protein
MDRAVFPGFSKIYYREAILSRLNWRCNGFYAGILKEMWNV